ncbi:MAG: hypothetical protein FWC94_01315 [Bacteroidales bacterium]|nr:hypothetical protein [Bacteroidales bacterium]
MRKIIGITAIFFVSIFCTSTASAGSFHGQWRSGTTVQGLNAYWTLNVDIVESVVTLSIVLFDTDSSIVFISEFIPANHWEIENNTLVIWVGNSFMAEGKFTLHISSDGEILDGNLGPIEEGEITPLNFSRLSDSPEKGVFTMNGNPFLSYEERIQLLRDFPDFATDGEIISFTYDLNRRDLYADLIERFNLDSVTAGYSDVELMIVLLNWVCDNFLHNGGSGMPHERNAFAIIDYLDNNPSGGNCRILAILLAEVLRLYGVEAKHITVHPKEPDGFVHVVTHAYSRRLNQWIMLDPTFRLVLKDSEGRFLDLPTLRTIFANGDEVFPNENAGRNNQEFHMESWRTFMAEHMFYFSSGTNFTFGSEDGRDGNTWNMLAPIGFENEFVTTYCFVTTHCANAFWATPQ